MNAMRLETLSFKPTDEAGKKRAAAEKAANDFEQLFVRQLVSTMRSAANVGGDGGMFGDGPGADTYADWFDQNVSEQVSRGGRVGIAEAILADMKRHKELPADAAEKRTPALRPLHETPTLKGAFDDRR
ncbi:MAG: Rod binding protein [Planctomycetota bacterium]|jgi:flagellar protein FlgJ